MKRLLTSILLAGALAGTAFSVLSCVDDPFRGMDYPGGYPGQHHGGKPDPNPNPEPNPPTPQKETFPGSSTYEFKAKAIYLGDQYGTCDDYVLYLYYGNYDENGELIGAGTELAFDMMCPVYTEMYIAPGTYNCSSDDFSQFHFLDGVEEKGTVYPSYLYRQYSDQENDYEMDLITAGTITVSNTGTTYTITANFTAGNEQYKSTYTGPIAFEDQSGGGEVSGLVEMNDIKGVEIVNWGQLWEAADANGDYYKLPVNDWVIYFDGQGKDEYVQVELLTDKDAEDVTGLFNEIITLDHPEEFKAGTVLYGYDEDNIAYGTWYCSDGNAIYAATKGQISISRKDDIYSFTFDFIDEEYDGEFKGQYTGKVTVSTAETTSMTSAFSSKRPAPVTKGSAPVRRTIKKNAAPRATKSLGRASE